MSRPTPPDRDDELVWYVAYGSNLCADRLTCYLSGGTPRGGRRHTAGARDPSPPRAWRRVELAHSIWFGGPSRTWRGGPAFLDVDRAGRWVGRAWLLTRGQLADIAAQENGWEAGAVDLDGVDRPRTVVPDGPYGRLQPLPPLEGRPAATVTFLARPARRDPDPAYADLIHRGLVETGVAPRQADAMLAAAIEGSEAPSSGPGSAPS